MISTAAKDISEEEKRKKKKKERRKEEMAGRGVRDTPFFPSVAATLPQATVTLKKSEA